MRRVVDRTRNEVVDHLTMLFSTALECTAHCAVSDKQTELYDQNKTFALHRTREIGQSTGRCLLFQSCLGATEIYDGVESLNSD